jgi:transcriptional regulator with XRE-family HTH domain
MKPEEIRERRIAAGLTQQALSDMSGIPIRTLRSWEIGERTPPDYTLGTLEMYINSVQKPKTVCGKCRHYMAVNGARGRCDITASDVRAIRPECVEIRKTGLSLFKLRIES